MMLLSNVAFSRNYVNDGLMYFWDFNKEKTFHIDRKSNINGFTQGKVRWIPPEFSYQGSKESGVIHIHGDKNPGSFFLVPNNYFDRNLDNWTVDYEFAVGTHAIDPAVRDRGELVDGTIFRWGDIKVEFFRDPGGARWKGVVVVEYRGKKKFIQDVKGFDYHYMAFRSEERGVSVWLNSYCTNLIERPVSSFVGEKMIFGGSGFSGRFDDIKVYSRRLRPWEITDNYWGDSLKIEPNKYNITTKWGKIKQR
tara:strand:+ start:42077 stop:42829 length:753 start_codon:yes stop_codon:yes gene_type:complete